MGALILLVFYFGFVHLIHWLLSKGIIWVMFELFQINWYGKFWIVYVALFIFGSIFKNNVTVRKN